MGTTSTRRDRIAEAGIQVIAQRGVRALTHRAVDDEAGLPPGSTSYYARTRSALIDEVVRLLAEHSLADLAEAATAFAAVGTTSRPAAPIELLDALVEAVDALGRRPDELAVRYALLLELDRDDPARAALAAHSPVQQQMAGGLADALGTCGVPDAAERAGELMALCDALLMHSAVTDTPTPVRSTLAAYLTGLGAATTSVTGSRK